MNRRLTSVSSKLLIHLRISRNQIIILNLRLEAALLHLLYIRISLDLLSLLLPLLNFSNQPVLDWCPRQCSH